MGECLITRRDGESYKLPILNENYPMDLTVVNGTEAIFYVKFTEHGKPADYVYRWYVDDIAVDGVNDSRYVRDITLDKCSHTIYCEVMNKAGLVTSRVATCNVIRVPVLDESYPKNITVDEAETSVTLEVLVTENVGDSECTYQWYYDGSAIEGATNRTYTRSAVLGTHQVYCIVTNQAGSTTSRTATVTANGVFLYRLGDTCSDLTGGWRAIKKAADSGDKLAATPTITYNTETMVMQQVSDPYRHGIVVTTSLIDLAKYNQLVFEGSVSDSNAAYISMVVWSSLGTYVWDNVAASKAMSSKTTLDISKLTGKYYVGFILYHEYRKITMRKLYLQ